MNRTIIESQTNVPSDVLDVVYFLGNKGYLSWDDIEEFEHCKDKFYFKEIMKCEKKLMKYYNDGDERSFLIVKNDIKNFIKKANKENIYWLPFSDFFKKDIFEKTIRQYLGFGKTTAELIKVKYDEGTRTLEIYGQISLKGYGDYHSVEKVIVGKREKYPEEREFRFDNEITETESELLSGLVSKTGYHYPTKYFTYSKYKDIVPMDFIDTIELYIFKEYV